MTRKVMEDLDNNIPMFENKSSPEPQVSSAPPPVSATAESAMGDEDDTMSYFAKLAAEN
jgi:hypothetical protein